MVTIPTYTDGQELPSASWNLVATVLNDLQGLLTTTGLTFPGAATIETTTGTLTIRSTGASGASLALTSTMATLAIGSGTVRVQSTQVRIFTIGGHDLTLDDATGLSLTAPGGSGFLATAAAGIIRRPGGTEAFNAGAANVLLKTSTGKTLTLTDATSEVDFGTMHLKNFGQLRAGAQGRIFTTAGFDFTLDDASTTFNLTNPTSGGYLGSASAIFIRRNGGTEAFNAGAANVALKTSSGKTLTLTDSTSEVDFGTMHLKTFGQLKAGAQFRAFTTAGFDLTLDDASTTFNLTNPTSGGYLGTATTIFIRRNGGSDAFTAGSANVSLFASDGAEVRLQATSGGSEPTLALIGGIPLRVISRGADPPTTGLGAQDVLLYNKAGRLYYMDGGGVVYGPL